MDENSPDFVPRKAHQIAKLTTKSGNTYFGKETKCIVEGCSSVKDGNQEYKFFQAKVSTVGVSTFNKKLQDLAG